MKSGMIYGEEREHRTVVATIKMCGIVVVMF